MRDKVGITVEMLVDMIVVVVEGAVVNEIYVVGFVPITYQDARR